MSTVAEKLHKWAIQELNFASDGCLSRIPDIESLKLLTKGKNKKIWTYVINHVRSQSAVAKVKRTLSLKKLLKEEEDDAVFFNDNSADLAKLQIAVSKATEKRNYYMRSLSIIEERLLNLEQAVKKMKDEVFQINQKTALFEHLKQLYEEKNYILSDNLSQILCCKNALSAYQRAKVCDKTTTVLPYDFLYENKIVFEEVSSTLKDIIFTSSSILKKRFNRDDKGMDTLIENFQSNICVLKTHGVLLTDLVILLEEMSESDFQQVTALISESVSVNEFILAKSKKDPANALLTRLKCDNVSNSLIAKRNKKEIEKLSLQKEKFKNENIEQNDLDYHTKCTLLETQAENDALVLSNSYLEDYLRHITNKCDALLKAVYQKKLCNESLSSTIQLFHNNADLTFYLLYSTPTAIKKALSDLSNLQHFAYNELFKLPFPRKEYIEELKSSFVSDKKLTWEHCDKTNLIKPLLCEHVTDHLMSAEIQKSLNFQPFQNISTLCEKWVHFKQKLRAEIAANAKEYERHDDINVAEAYAKILKMLECAKFSIEKGMLFISDGITGCHEDKSLIQEWWNQNAQYIPNIVYEGKTLKMWIDILSVLSDFEPQNYS